MLSLTQPHPQTRPTAPKPFQNATLPAARTALQQVLAVAHRPAPATGAIPTRTARGRFYRQSLGVSRNGGPQSPSLTALFAARGKEPTQIGKSSHTKPSHPQRDHNPCNRASSKTQEERPMYGRPPEITRRFAMSPTAEVRLALTSLPLLGATIRLRQHAVLVRHLPLAIRLRLGEHLVHNEP